MNEAENIWYDAVIPKKNSFGFVSKLTDTKSLLKDISCVTLIIFWVKKFCRIRFKIITVK